MDQNEINLRQAEAPSAIIGHDRSEHAARMPHEPTSPSPIIGSEEWVESFPDGLYDLAMEQVLQCVEQVERVDPSNRQLIWDDGEALSFDESLLRIRASLPQLPAELIRVHLIDWMDMDDLPGDLTEEEIKEMDVLMSAWAGELRRLDGRD